MFKFQSEATFLLKKYFLELGIVIATHYKCKLFK